ncbi:hypothetical protein OSTOST_02398 [Ostertagia ostertagi]
MINFSTSNRLRIMNTFFMKPEKRLWTWKSPNGAVKKQIDYVFPNDFQDVSVIGENIIATNSDHRMIRSTIIIDNALESRILAKGGRIGFAIILVPILLFTAMNTASEKESGMKRPYQMSMQTLTLKDGSIIRI